MRRAAMVLQGCLALLAMAPLAATGDEATLFSVADVAVDVNASSARDARAIAMLQGERAAFSRLFRKLVAEEDWALEPTLANDELAALVQGIDVNDERSSATRYMARLDVRFEAEEVRTLLGRLKVAYAETATRPTLLLPLFSYAGAEVLWGPINDWLAAWRAYPIGASLISYILPQGDVADRASLAPRNLVNIRPERLELMLRRYRSEDLILAHASLGFNALDGQPRLEVEVRRGVALEPVTAFTLAALPEEPSAALMTRAIARIDQTLSEAWKTQVLVQYGTQEQMTVSVSISDFAAWQDLLARVQRTALVRRVAVDRVSMTSADLSFAYFGGLEQLRRALREQGLSLEEAQDNGWRLRLGEAGAPPARVP
ncbi:MAG: DUF2066 domain-containing protein [Pseudomonadota bacterium]